MAPARARTSAESILGAHYWATLGVLVVCSLLMAAWLAKLPIDPVATAGGAETADRPNEPPSPAASTRAFEDEEALRDLVSDEERWLDEWSMLLAELCSDPDLLSRKLRVDCRSGSLYLSESAFFSANDVTLSKEGKTNLLEAISIYLARLRGNDRLWRDIESIEFRGHSDATAKRAPYPSNLVSSQQRALSVLLYLVDESTPLPPEDSEDLMRLAVASGASYSRPPADCPESNAECRRRWRRVEIRLAMRDAALHDRMADYHRRLRSLLPPAD
jgi:flagellar motor protein MotB